MMDRPPYGLVTLLDKLAQKWNWRFACSEDIAPRLTLAAAIIIIFALLGICRTFWFPRLISQRRAWGELPLA